jgi:hypothetical protein
VKLALISISNKIALYLLKVRRLRLKISFPRLHSMRKQVYLARNGFKMISHFPRLSSSPSYSSPPSHHHICIRRKLTFCISLFSSSRRGRRPLTAPLSSTRATTKKVVSRAYFHANFGVASRLANFQLPARQQFSYSQLTEYCCDEDESFLQGKVSGKRERGRERE